jgi:hypothetical protein
VPYFVRQPYVAPASAPRQPEDSADILELAKSVLAREAGDREKPPFRIREPLRPGGRGAMVLELALDAGSPARTISLVASDLSRAGSRIASDSIRICPSTLTLRTGVPVDIRVTVSAPPGVQPGRYDGTISAAGDDSFAIPFQVEVS